MTIFLGGRRVPVWAVALSVLATALSAVTFVAAPADAFGGDLSYLILNIGGVIGAVMAATLFIPVFHRAGTLTIYGYLGQRYGPGSAAAGGIAFPDRPPARLRGEAVRRGGGIRASRRT